MDANFNIEEIEKYLDGTLQGADLKNFQERLETDKALAQRVDLIKNIDLSIGDEKAVALQKQTMDFGAEFFTETPPQESKVKRIPFYRRPLAIAAGFLLVVALLFLVQQQFNSGALSGQDLFAAYYSPYQASNVTRGNQPDANIFEQGIQQYQTQNYTQAIQSLQEFLSANNNDLQASFYLGHAFLNEAPPKLKEAEEAFQKIIQDGKSILVPKSKWYLALIYLRQEELAKAKDLLQELVQSQDNKVAAQAKDLLTKF